ncbi:MAG: NAD(P)-dependent oxidoreductase [Opitutales bacterium]
MSDICIAGLGIIGSIWARHYAADGHHVRAWNRTPQPQTPYFVEDLAEASSGADVVHICVADPPAVQVVLDVITPMLKSGELVIQSSTISPLAAESFAPQVTERGASYVEAPFTGSSPKAESRELVFYAGGDASALDTAEPYLRELGAHLLRLEGVAQAAALKLSMNLQIAAITQALTEGYHLALAYGLDHDAFFAGLRLNGAHTAIAERKEPKLRDNDYTPQFSVKHMAKDLGLALASAQAADNLNLLLTERTRELYAAAIAAGLGDLDFAVLEKLVTAPAPPDE